MGVARAADETLGAERPEGGALVYGRRQGSQLSESASFSKRLFRHDFKNLFFVLVMIRDKLTDL